MDQCTHWQTRGQDIFRCGLASQHEGVHEYMLSGRCESVSNEGAGHRCVLPEGHPDGQQYHCVNPNNPLAGWWHLEYPKCGKSVLGPGNTPPFCLLEVGHDGRCSSASPARPEPKQCEAQSGGLLKVRCGLPEGHPEGQEYHCPDPNNPNAGWWPVKLAPQCPSTYEYPIGTVNQCEQRTGHTGHHSHVGAVWEDPRPTYAEQTPAQREETDQSVRDFLGSASEPDAITAPTLNFQMLSERLDRVLLGEAGERRAMQEGFEQQLQARASVSAHGRTRTKLNQVARRIAELDERLAQLELQTGKSEMRVYGVDVSEWDQRWLMFEKTMAVLMERLSPPTVVNANGDVVVTDHPEECHGEVCYAATKTRDPFEIVPSETECGTQFPEGPCAGNRGHRGDCTANADDIPPEPDPDAGGHWKS